MTKVSTLIRQALAVAGAAAFVAGAAMPAQARDDVTVRAAAPSGASGAAEAPADKKYCLTTAPSTGSRVTQTKCRTKAEWSARGVELAIK